MVLAKKEKQQASHLFIYLLIFELLGFTFTSFALVIRAQKSLKEGENISLQQRSSGNCDLQTHHRNRGPVTGVDKPFPLLYACFTHTK